MSDEKKTSFKKYFKKIKFENNIQAWLMVSTAVMIIGAVTFSYSRQIVTRVVHMPKKHSFKGGRVLVDGSSVYKRRNQNLQRQLVELRKQQVGILDSLKKFDSKFERVKNEQAKTLVDNPPANSDANKQMKQADSSLPKPVPPTTIVGPTGGSNSQDDTAIVSSEGPSVISFPTKSKERRKDRVHLAAGSYIETVLLSGVQASGGKPYPVLLKVNQSFVGPNSTRVDLSGCFILGKALGNLSLERVEIKPYKMACTSRSGKIFEREITGFVADKGDNSFGVKGKVDLKSTSRVATLTFLSSVIQGISKNIEKLQTKTEQTENGVSSSVTGSSSRYIVAGGAAGAADKMTEFYLRHANDLLPTINVNSSQKLYVVIQDAVDLPSWYFKPNKENRSTNDFKYLSRLID